MSDVTPQKYVECRDQPVPAGKRKVNINLSFHYDPGNETLFQMAKGLEIYNTDINSGSDFAQYEVLLIAGDGLERTSIYIPQCFTEKDLGLIRDKSKPTIVPISFQVVKRNHKVRPYYFGTADELAERLGNRSPI